MAFLPSCGGVRRLPSSSPEFAPCWLVLMTVRCDGEERALGFGQELNMIDAALKTAEVDTKQLKCLQA
ncbi:hypothetical protein B0G71_0690 [Paraburkholderia sp. BL27I4N3]|uniref:hypothetical protein n=1 Tax=Paraburkholderia sp. BL27I4N3 TaxID=1938805 RepID=UPI000E287ADC|nr:hypothetical protein [Paraburkholderia sp. BL27I4N3]REE17728.1 hypothetical protein B0G71_0690 [Paraburkholderia sp. BL27I4N3]